MEENCKTLEKVSKKLEELTNTKDKLVKELQQLQSQFETGRRNLDAIEGAIFILKELDNKIEEQGGVDEVIEPNKESKH